MSRRDERSIQYKPADYPDIVRLCLTGQSGFVVQCLAIRKSRYDFTMLQYKAPVFAFAEIGSDNQGISCVVWCATIPT